MSCNKCYEQRELRKSKAPLICHLKRCAVAHLMQESYQIYINLWYMLRTDIISSTGLGVRIVDELDLSFSEIELLTILDFTYNKWQAEKLESKYKK